MNSFLDPYDLTSGTPPQQSEQSLNEEVSQAIGQVGRLWGAFRKQSQNALETARKDFSGVVSQAQQELSRLTMETPKSPEPTQPGSDSGDESTTPRTGSPAVQDPSTTTTAGLFSRLQSALPPNIVATVQSHIPESLKNASENIDFAQMRSTLTSEFQRVQGVTRAQAEEYVHKSEALLRDAMKEAGEVLRDAVKVVPPDAQQSGVGSNSVSWDGTDLWMMPFDGPESGGKGRERAASQSAADSQLAVATRAEALLKRLRHDPEIIKLDPEADAGVKEIYTQWLASSMKDGLESDEWTAKITALLNDSPDGQALQANQDSLVPSLLTREVFWKRYFFRVHQIEQEEEKRKALLQRSTTESEEDFSWEDDDDATPGAATAKSPTAASDAAHTVISVPSSGAPTPATTSPRESSEESYDVVSSDGAGKDKADKKAAESDNDSDWE
ncbi:BSD domain-containing protein [Mycena indigotica]|uniref:BSD domain-containing protein n=1 Tax=Mycena indigotica TaxID=2126181 RepID=A0A8H6TBM0_9AGAR|nr:BSD domain-containing protein [Mycena indigotica]KAF7315538.1 BSD domain-containing protein [Mycena indigotica]